VSGNLVYRVKFLIMFSLSLKIKQSQPKITLLILAMLIFFISDEIRAQNLTKQFKSVVGHSNFIFLGTVTHVDSSNIAVKLQKKNKAIVRVDEVIDATEPLFRMKGKEITMVFASDLNHPKNSKQVFYTFIWYYGSTLGVKEVKNNLEKKFHPQLSNLIRQSRAKISDDSLSAELARAKIVVFATVKNISEYIPVRGLEQSEHNPKFRKVVFDVKEVLKGKTKKDSLTAYYASSYDVMWIDSPKLSEGSEGVFLLHDQQTSGFFEFTGYTLLDPRDFQNSSELKRIKNLLGSLTQK